MGIVSEMSGTAWLVEVILFSERLLDEMPPTAV